MHAWFEFPLEINGFCVNVISGELFGVLRAAKEPNNDVIELTPEIQIRPKLESKNENEKPGDKLISLYCLFELHFQNLFSVLYSIIIGLQTE